MKKFLIQHEREFNDNTNNEDASEDNLNSRLLLQWAFHIAKGMQYLARMHIMHGDLAARNILIGTGNVTFACFCLTTLKKLKPITHCNIIIWFISIASLADKDENGSPKLVAKVSDFGLSKTFYDNIRYKRQSQQYIPWKWMALESEVVFWNNFFIIWIIFIIFLSRFGKKKYCLILGTTE